MKSICFLSTALSDGIYNEIVQNCNSFKPTFSGVGFDRNIGVGLSRRATVCGMSFFPIPSYPKYNKIKQNKANFVIENFDCIVPGILDLPLVKELSFNRATKDHILKQQKEYDAIIICGLYRSLLRPAIAIKRKLGIPIIAIVPDLPELMMDYRTDYNGVRKFLNRIDVYETQKYRKSIDGFVFLSKYMNEVVNKLEKRYCIVDGLTDLSVFPNVDKELSEKYILYAGKISKKFGVDKLIKGFLNANLSEVYLYLCGDGDYSSELKSISQTNCRVKYLGMVFHSDALKLEVNASLLVDPRPSNMELVKMSFPSKIIEYMASGTPLLTTNLPCFSEEYQKYQYRIQDESIEGITCALENVFKKSSEELKAFGDAAKDFIMNNKTLDKQCEKIMSLIEGVTV